MSILGTANKHTVPKVWIEELNCYKTKTYFLEKNVGVPLLILPDSDIIELNKKYTLQYLTEDSFRWWNVKQIKELIKDYGISTGLPLNKMDKNNKHQYVEYVIVYLQIHY